MDLESALALYEAGEFEKTIALCRDLLALEPRQSDVWHLLGVALLMQGHTSEAVDSLLTAREQNSTGAQVHQHLSAAYQAAGQIAAAISAMQEASRLAPNSALHANALGRLLTMQGAHGDAEPCFRRAIESDPGLADAHNNLGNCLCDLGRPGEAIAHFESALAQLPNSAEVAFNLANACKTTGMLDRAAEMYRQAIDCNPSLAAAHHNLATLLYDSQDFAEAVRHASRALELEPAYVEAKFVRAASLQAAGQHDEALADYREIVRSRPEFLPAHEKQLRLVIEHERWDEAEDCCRRLIELSPHDQSAHVQLANLLDQAKRFDESEVIYRKLLALEPSHIEASLRLANSLRMQGKLPEALDAYLRTRALAPERADIIYSLAACQQSLGAFAAALESFDRVIALTPDDPDSHFYCGMTLLTLGDFERGWAEFEWRRKSRFAEHQFPQFAWQGEPLAGRRLLVHAEWGYGDTMHFARYVKALRERGNDVLFAVQPHMLPLMRSSGFDPLCTTVDAEMPPCDLQVPLLSLPRIFGTNLTNIPAPIPYLRAIPELVSEWRERLRPISGLKVGIHWHGARRAWQDDRAVPLIEFAPLAQVPGVTLISLQKEGEDELAALAGKFQVIDFGAQLDNQHGPFVDTAALIENLDLVISCDTAVPHLAGALGKPVWIAHMLAAEWRWFAERDDSPWYPTMRLFRQQQHGDWTGVFQRIAGELRHAAKSRQPVK